MNDLELQRWLASQLPEEIMPRNTHGGREFIEPEAVAFSWWSDGKSVTPREWDRVARMVEAKLTNEQLLEYDRHLESECWHVDGEFNDGRLSLIRATWQQRTRALKGVLK